MDRRDARCIRKDSRHRSVLWERAHEAGALGDEAETILEAEDARDARRDIFANAVTENSMRLDAPRTPGLREGILEGEERRLGVLGLMNVVVVGEKNFEQGTIDDWVENFCAFIERGAEDGLRFVKRASHASVLRALPCEEKCYFWF